METRKRVLLAVLGRGCMMSYPGGPWTATKDFDWWKLGAMRPEVITAGPDDDPNVVVDGGELQLAAAAMLYRELDPLLAVFAYGNRSPYLKKRGFPSESRIMSGLFTQTMLELSGEAPRIDVFNEEFWGVEGSSSYQEVHNLLFLAKKIHADEVVFQTIMVHMNRVLVMVAKHLRDDPEFADMKDKVRFEITESVLLRGDAKSYAKCVFSIFGSQAYLRNLERELNGSRAMYQGVTQSQQNAPAVANGK